MRKAMIYPFSARCLPLTLYFSKFQPEYSISALVSPVGLGLFGRTPFYAANRTHFIMQLMLFTVQLLWERRYFVVSR